jgi:DNA mismatch repair protein MutS2
MQASTLRALEFDRIREALARQALTPLGRARAYGLEPSIEVDEVRGRLGLTVEALTFVRAGGSLALHAPEDLDESLRIVDIDDQPLEPLRLLGLADFVESVDRVVSGLRAAARQHERAVGEGLVALAARATSFTAEVAAVRKAIEPSGDVSDNASPALRDIRDGLRKRRAKLRNTLEGLTRGRDTAKYLQDQIVTDRHGRYVVVVRAEHREAIAGIVHGSSTSGASLFLEPLTTVPLNNEIVELAEQEQIEIARILLALTNGFRRRGEELAATVEAASDLDELYAKVSLAERQGAVAPALVDDGRIDFLAARHPLLGGTPTAVTLRLVPPTRALVISGPNTGGKTVALKAVGLLALMAQSGLLIPVEAGSQMTPLRSIFADIGDEQSISASLSTFSAHIGHIVAMDRALELPALVLLDEVGSGTDPIEGGALGVAIIDHFRQRGALVVATTHDDALKSYAATTEGVTTAAFGFEPETYAPTYQLIYGAPGRSLALEIADRLGMPASVVAAARARRSGRESQLAEHLARVDRELALLDQEKRKTEAERQALHADRERLLDRESRLAEREAVLKKRLDDKLNERLRDARLEVDRIVGRLKEKADALADRAGKPTIPAVSTGDVGQLRAEARTALGAIGEPIDVGGSDGGPAALERPPAIGDSVYVATFGAEGIVRGVSGAKIDVDVRGKRMRVSLTDLRAKSNGEPASGGRKSSTRGGVSVDVASRSSGGPAAELMVIGNTVDEALGRAEKFLDAALLNDERRLRVVHGHGTGKLREALTKFFRAHPLVASVSAAGDKEGGGGATIVELKD